MTYPHVQLVQWIARSKRPGGSAYAGTGYAEAAAVPVEAVFAPGGSTETTQTGDTVVTQPALYGVDPSLGVSAVDVFLIGGHRFEVAGDPAVWPGNPMSGWVPNGGATAVVQLRRVTG